MRIWRLCQNVRPEEAERQVERDHRAVAALNRRARVFSLFSKERGRWRLLSLSRDRIHNVVRVSEKKETQGANVVRERDARSSKTRRRPAGPHTDGGLGEDERLGAAHRGERPAAEQHAVGGLRGQTPVHHHVPAWRKGNARAREKNKQLYSGPRPRKLGCRTAKTEGGGGLRDCRHHEELPRVLARRDALQVAGVHERKRRRVPWGLFFSSSFFFFQSYSLPERGARLGRVPQVLCLAREPVDREALEESDREGQRERGRVEDGRRTRPENFNSVKSLKYFIFV